MNKITTGAVLALSSLLGLTACQKQPETREQVHTAPVTSNASAHHLAAGQLTAKVVQAAYTLPPCDAKGCPQIDIQRLDTNKAWINQFLNQQILELSSVQLSEQPVKLTTLQANVDRFVQAARQDSVARGVLVPYSMQVTPELLGEKGHVALFKISAAFYTGGAHGSALDRYYNLDLKQKKQLKLADLLLPDQQPKLYELVHQHYIDWIKQDDASADVAKYEQDWPFKLTDNFTFTEQGLLFSYGQYEIGPYAVGMPEFIIPNDQLTGMIKPDYLTAPLQLQKQRVQAPQPAAEQHASTGAH